MGGGGGIGGMWFVGYFAYSAMLLGCSGIWVVGDLNVV